MTTSSPYILPNVSGRFVTDIQDSSNYIVFEVSSGTSVPFAVSSGGSVTATSNATSAFASNLAQGNYTSTINNSINQTIGTSQNVVDPNQQGTPGSSTPSQNPPPNTTPSSSGADLRYPENIKDGQDKIKFSVYELKKSTMGSTLSLSNPDDNSAYEYKNINIVLPIQASISDQNTVTWGSGELNELQKELANLSFGFMNKGKEAVDAAITKAQEAFTQEKQIEKLKGLGQVYFAEQALGIGGLMSRATGQVLNPNLELLFQGPTLRSFQFQFKLSPRTQSEATIVKKIIKEFKKNMAVRKDGDLFLKAPYVFQIEYLKGNSLHKSINRIKKCALQGFNVDYTPLGTYMTYNDEDATMVSYNLSMQFQEIVPIYDKDYDDHPIGF